MDNRIVELQKEACKKLACLCEYFALFGIENNIGPLWMRVNEYREKEKCTKWIDFTGGYILTEVKIQKKESACMFFAMVSLYFYDLLRFDTIKAQEFIYKHFLNTLPTKIGHIPSITLEMMVNQYVRDDWSLYNMIRGLINDADRQETGFCMPITYAAFFDFTAAKKAEVKKAENLAVLLKSL